MPNQAVLGAFLSGQQLVGLRVPVPSVYPSGSLVSITGQATCGDGHVAGGIAASQFGTPTIRLTKAVSAVPSAQAFGVPTFTISAAPQTRAVSGVPSAQAFGTVLIKAVIGVGGVGVNSAQAFGAITPRAGPVTVAVQGLGSAQNFGTEFFVGTKWLWDLHCIVGIDMPITGEVITGDGHVCGGTNRLTEIDCITSGPILATFLCGQETIGQQHLDPMPPVLVRDLEPVGCR